MDLGQMARLFFVLASMEGSLEESCTVLFISVV